MPGAARTGRHARPEELTAEWQRKVTPNSPELQRRAPGGIPPNARATEQALDNLHARLAARANISGALHTHLDEQETASRFQTWTCGGRFHWSARASEKRLWAGGPAGLNEIPPTGLSFPRAALCRA